MGSKSVAVICGCVELQQVKDFFYSPGDATVFATSFQVGDAVQYIGHTSYSSNMRRGRTYEVLSISRGEPTGGMVEINGEYYPVYYQKLKLKNFEFTAGYSSKNFTLFKKNERYKVIELRVKPMALAVDRPCIVFQFEETVEEGATKAKRKFLDKGKNFDNMQTAKTWVEEQIVTSIRDKNIYPKYSIFEERFVGRAEKPPVVFE